MGRHKCPICKGCLEDYYIGPDFYLYCFLCKLYYRLIDGKLTKVDNPNDGG